MVGRKLKIARTAAGLSLRGLEARIVSRVTAQAIGKYERGASTPSPDVLTALANALSVPVDYLNGDQEIVLESVEFRKKKITGRREEAQVEAKVLHLLERYLEVEEFLHLTSVNWDKPRDAPYPVVSDPSEAERAANNLRLYWGLGFDPIPDLVELVEEHGIKVLAIDLGNIDGLMARVRRPGKRQVPVLVVNDKDGGERQRLTMAHELGHLVLDVAANIDDEKAAYRFGGAFLMPAEALWGAVGKRRTSIGWSELFALKQLFGVSVQALTYRCKDLGIISLSLFRVLFGEFSRQGWRRPPYEEPYAMPAEAPQRFERLCYRAMAEGAIPVARAAELLQVSVAELNRSMLEPPSKESVENHH